MAMQMVTRMRKEGAEGLEMTTLFELPTVVGLAEQLERLGVPVPDSGAARTSEDDEETAALLAEVAALSDDEVQARLAELEGDTGA
ncbi:hypothetical protein SAV31267_089580 [Streptomyces avermitilis]|nr:hypothetical protein SAV31267_089580 [Streptomyces avermitilis]